MGQFELNYLYAQNEGKKELEKNVESELVLGFVDTATRVK